jgi:hypothetical protein
MFKRQAKYKRIINRIKLEKTIGLTKINLNVVVSHQKRLLLLKNTFPVTQIMIVQSG